MSDPASYTTQLRQKLIELRELIAPAQIRDFDAAIRKCAEVKLITGLLKAELERMEKVKRESEWELEVKT